MKKRKVISWLLGIPVLIITLIIIIVWNEPERDGISRGSAYKSAALSLTSAENCKQMFETEPSYFLEKDQKQWYTVYMDYLYRQGYLSVELTKPNAATAEGWLTYEEADA
ncbi:MAG: stage II sporulation protein SpoIID, partial [Hungatella sp.]